MTRKKIFLLPHLEYGESRMTLVPFPFSGEEVQYPPAPPKNREVSKVFLKSDLDWLWADLLGILRDKDHRANGTASMQHKMTVAVTRP